MTSQLNKTDTPLGASEIYTGPWEYLRDHEGVGCFVQTDQSGTVKVQYSLNGVDLDITDSFPVEASVDFHKVVSKKGRYLRVVYENDLVAQTTFKLRTHFQKNAPEVNHSDVLVALDLLDSSLNTIESNSTFTASRLNNIQNKLSQNTDGTGSTAGQMLDGCDSSLNTIESNSTLSASRLNNIQNKLSQNTDGTGSTAGQMLDGCDSSLNTIESNSTLTASRLNNVQNKLSENADGSGDSAGILLKAIDTRLTTQATHNTNLLAKTQVKQSSTTTALNSVVSSATTTASSAIDVSSYSKVTVYGSTGDTSGSSTFFVTVSNVTGGTYYSDNMTLGKTPNTTDGQIIYTMDATPFNFMKVNYKNVSGSDKTVLLYVTASN